MLLNSHNQCKIELPASRTQEESAPANDETAAIELYRTVLRHNAVDTVDGDLFTTPSSRSALFQRLKHAKQALVFPPPSRFYKPAYDLIEEDGFHSITSIDVGYTEATIFVDQCEYVLLDANSAAKRLLEIARTQIEKCKCQGQCPRVANANCTPNWNEVVEAYSEEPEFIVHHHQWPAFKITVGRATRTVAFDRVSATLSQGFSLAKDASPLNLPVFLLNASVRGIARSDTLDQKAHEFEQLVEAANCNDTFRRNIAGAQLALNQTLDSYLKPYRDDPRLLDWLNVECDSWKISKDHADWHHFPIYLDPDSSLS